MVRLQSKYYSPINKIRMWADDNHLKHSGIKLALNDVYMIVLHGLTPEENVALFKLVVDLKYVEKVAERNIP